MTWLNTSQFGFVTPLALWALIPVSVCILVCIYHGLHQQAHAARILGISSHTSAPRVALLALFVPVCGVLSMARPYWGSEDIDIKTTGLDYIFLVDVSRSMLANDLSPTRVDVAKRKIKDIISTFRAQGISNRYGITLFAGESYPFCPLTSDIGALQQFITWIHPEMITAHGSNLAGGVATALERFKTDATGSGRVLLISDGEDDKLQLAKVVERVEASGIPFDVLGIGTPQGSTIRLGRDLLRNQFGQQVVSRLHEESLAAIAKSGGGVYVRSELGDGDVAQLIRSARGTQVVTGNGSQKLRIYHEIGPLLAAVGLIGMLILRVAGRHSTLLATVLLLLFFIPTNVHAEDPGRTAYKMYEAGQWKESASLFKDALRKDPNNPALKQGLASALFKSGDPKGAEALFSELSSSAQSGHAYAHNQYNLGNTLLLQERFDEAIEAYQCVLAMNPDDEKAAHNQRVARLRKEAKQQEEQKQQQSEQQQQHQPQQKEAQESDKSESTQQERQQGSQQETSKDNPEQQSSPQSGGEPPPNASGTPSEAQGAIATPTPSPNVTSSTPTGTETSEQSKGAEDSREEDTPPSSSGLAKGGEKQELTQQYRAPLGLSEAEAWIESLPDAPARIVQLQGRAYSEEQPW